MSGILTALWRLANPVAGTLCLQRPPRGFRLGRCRLDVGHPGDAHMDARGSTWAVVEIDEEEA